MTDIVERLKTSTEQMAHRCSVDMALWDRHSNAALEAAAEILRLRNYNDTLNTVVNAQSEENAFLRAENAGMREALTWYGDQMCEFGNSYEGCGRLDVSDCAGCIARGTLRDSAPSGKGADMVGGTGIEPVTPRV